MSQRLENDEVDLEDHVRDLSVPLVQTSVPSASSKLDEAESTPGYGFSSLLRYTEWLDIALYLIGLVTACIFGGIAPFQAKVIGNVFSGNAGADTDALKENIMQNIPKLIELGLVALVAGYVQMVFLCIVTERIVRRVRYACLQSLLRQDIEYYDSKTTGQVSTMLAEQSQFLLKGVSESVGQAFQYTSQMAIAYVIAFNTNSKVAGTLMGILPVLSIIIVMIIYSALKYLRRLDKANEEAGGYVEEILSSIQTVAAFKGEEKAIHDYENCLDEADYYARFLVKIRSFGVSAMLFVLYSTFGIAYWYGATLIATNSADFGSVLTTVLACVIGAMSMGIAVPVVQALTQAKTAIDALFAIIDREPEMDSTGFKTVPDLDGKIEFINVSFNYPNRLTPVFRSISFTVDVGQTCALVGQSGCGKSTCVSLLERFYDPTGGRIEINGTPIQEFRLKHLRSQIALVSQEPVLFATTIASNIWLGTGEDEANMNMDRIVAAAQMANCHSFIVDFPYGYETDCGSFGTQLSGGQKQRVSLARALIRNPKILLLDEATSALDNESERIVQSAIDKLLEEKHMTTIVIAHRLSTIEKADKIVVFGLDSESGLGAQVVESGTHQELMKIRNGVYHSLVESGNRGVSAPNDIVVRTSSASSDVFEEDEYDTHVDGLLRSAAVLTDPIHKTPSFHRSASSSISNKSLPTSPSNNSLPLTRSVSVNSGRTSFHSIPLSVHDDEHEHDDHDDLYPVSYSRLWRENAKAWKTIFLGTLASGLKGASNPTLSLILSHALASFVMFPNIINPPEMCQNTTDCISHYECLPFFGKGSFCCDGYVPGHGPSDVRSAGFQTFYSYVLVALFVGTMVFVNSHCYGSVALDLTFRLKLEMFKSYLRMDAAYYDSPKHHVGVLVSSLATDPLLVQNVTNDYLGMVVENLIASIVGLSLAFAASWRMTSALLVPIMLLLICTAASPRRAFAAIKVKMDVDSGKVINQALSSVRTIYSCTAESNIMVFYKEFLDGSVHAGIRNANIAGLQNGVAQCVFQLVYAFTFWYGAHLISKNLIGTHELSKVFFVLTLTAQGIGQSFARANDTSKATVAISNIYRLLDSSPEIDYTKQEGEKNLDFDGNISFDSVSFAYPTRPSTLVLRNFTLEVAAGETVAFVGPSGSGKSSVIRLLERFYDPTGGKISLDGYDIRFINLGLLRAQFGLVSQEPILFRGSIAENVLYGLPDEERKQHSKKELEEMVQKACSSANADQFISEFDLGYETLCGSKGVSLSGGQKQRIAIARAIIRDPNILLLDEATSALDNESERLVQEALDTLVEHRKRTTLIIAHRLSTIRDSSKIVVLEGGRVVEVGTHTCLMANNGTYSKLYKVQHKTQRQDIR